ncbi:hypothetical protein RY27_02610, partial [Litorilinea aerophila]
MQPITFTPHAFGAQALSAQGITKTRTICGYCGVGCAVDVLTRDDRIVAIHPAMDGPANQGALCV